MWKQLLNLAGRFWRIAEDVERVKTDVADLRQELREMGRVVDWLVSEVRHARETESHEREKLALRLENALLRFERRLPGGKQGGRGN
jgi:predicted  nucleic acid-binding Zn-ribbon protein